jgi:GTP-binding protein
LQKFADEAFIEVSSGAGGNGCASFRREKFMPKGGPSGGDGGRGGDLIFTVKRNLRTLSHLRYKHTFKAENGHDGESGDRYGRKGEDCYVPVPPGTALWDDETDELVHDFGKDESDFLYLKGGNGGWGNIHFKTSVNQAPRKALPGQPGTTRALRVELQIMADIGLVGFPNAGKSSLLDKFTNSRPKIAPYPFTTKIPNLGVLSFAGGSGDADSYGDTRDIIIADIPGIIEGASEGAGLGIQFLKHISRTRALVFLIDLSDDNYGTAFETLLAEIGAFSEELPRKKRIVLGSKLDLDGTAERLEELRASLPDETVLGISVFSGVGLQELRGEIVGLVTGDR